VAREQGNFVEALADLERAAAIFIEFMGENSSEVAAVLQEIGTTQSEMRRFDDARQSFDRAQAIYNHIYPDGHRHVGGLMERRCDMYVDAQQYADAVAACDLALENAERFGLADIKTEKEIYELLVAAERGRGRTAAAERAQAKLDELNAAIEAAAKKADDP
jgi:tetratricopeptide (TPR) repeat protein